MITSSTPAGTRVEVIALDRPETGLRGVLTEAGTFVSLRVVRLFTERGVRLQSFYAHELKVTDEPH